MSLTVKYDYRRKTSFPRVSGDEPESGSYWCVDARFSPRERG